MKSRDERNTRPEIIEAADLTHINPNNRLGLIGGTRQWLKRRDFFRGMLGAGALFSTSMASCIPDSLLDSGDKDETVVPCASEADTTCTAEADTTCTAQNDSTCTCESHTETVPAPRVVFMEYEGVAVVDDLNPHGFNIHFSKFMNKASVEAAITLTPSIGTGLVFHWHDNDTSKGGVQRVYVRADDSGDYDGDGYIREDGASLRFDPGTDYTLTIAADAKDTEGIFIDGDDDGTGGDAYAYTFSTKSVAPPIVVSSHPMQNEPDVYPSTQSIIIRFSERMNETSVEQAFSVNPAESQLTDFNWKYEMTDPPSKCQLYIKNSNNTYNTELAGDTQYTITIAATATDIYGNHIDGNGDGEGGDAYTLQFSTETVSCSCESHISCSCESYSSCSCQSDDCSIYGGELCPFDNPCTTDGCLCEVECACQTYNT